MTVPISNHFILFLWKLIIDFSEVSVSEELVVLVYVV